MRRVFMGLVAVVMAATAAHAWEWDYGYWYVSQEPSEDGFHKTIAILSDGDLKPPIFAVRCIERTLDLVVQAQAGSVSLKVGTGILVNFGSDAGLSEHLANGVAVRTDMVEFLPGAAIAHELLAGAVYSVRFQPTVQAGPPSFNHTWSAQNRASALSWVQKDCPFN